MRGMMSIKRYDMGDKCGGEYCCNMVEAKRGDYVEFDDHETLMREKDDEIAELKQENARLGEENDELRLAINRLEEEKE